MFTGLIEEVGVIAAVDTTPAGSRMTVSAEAVLENVSLGDSIAIDGACMTVVDFTAHSFTFEVSPESLSKTNFGSFTVGKRVNLERPLTPNSRIGGHYVTGHVDGLARVISKEPQGNSWVFTFEVPSPELASLLIPKGSVAVLGISLTVNTVTENRFTVAIIPHTLTHTNLGDYNPGDSVNIETDLLGKYVKRLLSTGLHTSPYCVAEDDTVSSYPVAQELEPGLSIDAPSLAPAMNAMQLTHTAPKGANIRAGSWFNHDPE